MKSVILILCLFSAQIASAACSMYCTPGKSYACGDACIPVNKMCRKPTTSACNGVRPKEATKHYSNPEHVEPKDYSKEVSGK